ncbi:Methylthioadenosine phosphorylase [Ramicandelaber brevisporus]|nr:Methylthioadenosine phosphorylase [Ramicandelaber brevisporus]
MVVSSSSSSVASSSSSSSSLLELYKDTPIKIGVIGGTGLYNLEGLELKHKDYIQTPWGRTSSQVRIFRFASTHVAFIARHGDNHEFSPSEVPVRANIAALKLLGVEVIVAYSAVGSLREEIVPGHFVLPDQLIDRTKGIRPSTYFEGTGIVAHAGFADPFHNGLAQLIKDAADTLNGEDANQQQLVVHAEKTVIVMEGPAFSTRAESRMYRSWGGDIINMSALPESKLAREAEIAYQMICMSTDYDCWRTESGSTAEGDVTVQHVMQTMKQNAHNANRLVGKVLPLLDAALRSNDAKYHLGDIKGSMEFSIMAGKEARQSERAAILRTIYPNYF